MREAPIYRRRISWEVHLELGFTFLKVSSPTPSQGTVVKEGITSPALARPQSLMIVFSQASMIDNSFLGSFSKLNPESLFKDKGKNQF